MIFKNCAQFTVCISEINNKEIDHAKDIDVVMPIHNLIEHGDDYLKTHGNLWQYCRDEPFMNNDSIIIDVSNDPDNASLNYKQKITGQIENNGRKDSQIILPLKY